MSPEVLSIIFGPQGNYCYKCRTAMNMIFDSHVTMKYEICQKTAASPCAWTYSERDRQRGRKRKEEREREGGRWSVASRPLWVSVIAVDMAFYSYNSHSSTAPNTFRSAPLWILMTTVRSRGRQQRQWWWWWVSSISRLRLRKVYMLVIFKRGLMTCDFISIMCGRLMFVCTT